ncbi:HPF/RaiA family ribosome-associated protein [Bdellovibrio sp. HCB337]|uniref:HPF/RaiA family ribosome-associated protein n=1 Tax=Bdellovibrio sp. HCB337 TaxID=3394358 RepID=UPI0039A6B7FC
MRTEIFFNGIHRSDYVNDFITDKVELITDKLMLDKDLHVVVRVEKDRERTSTRSPVFQCEITVKSGVSDRTFKVVKQDRNLFRAIVKSSDALKVLLGKSHDRLRQENRHLRAPEVIDMLSEINPPAPIAST